MDLGPYYLFVANLIRHIVTSSIFSNESRELILIIVEVETKHPESLSNLLKRLLKTTNISLFSSRKSKNLAFSCDGDNIGEGRAKKR